MGVKGMTRAEMILKVVMDASETNPKFVAHYTRLLPDSDVVEFQKILDMKGVRRSDQQQLIDLYRTHQSSEEDKSVDSTLQSTNLIGSESHVGHHSPEHESSRIKKLEKLIKRRL